MDKIINRDMIKIIEKIYQEMLRNKDYLIELDSQAGDGDLGISMCHGFAGVIEELSKQELTSMLPKKIMLKAAMAMNEHSPSSLGTILCAGMMGGAKTWGDKEHLGIQEFSDFVEGSLQGIMKRAGSKRGEKTILDALGGASDALIKCVEKGLTLKESATAAADGAYAGMEQTKDMMAVHGRAAYYQEKTLGHIDGGATVGMLIFKAINESIQAF